MLNTREMRNAVGIFAAALVLRLAYAFFVKEHYFFYGHPGSDVTYYWEWAEAIRRGQADGTAFMGLPLYPHVLAVFMGLSFKHAAVIRFLHLLLGSINAALVYFIGRQIFDRRVGLLAGALTAGNFILIYFDWLMMPVPVLIFLALIVILTLLHPERLTRPRDWAMLGLIAGLGMFGDGKFLIFGVFLSLWLIVSAKEKMTVLKRAVLPFLVGLMLLPLAVSARTKAVTGEWVFISAQSGLSFFVGNNPEASGIFENPEFIRPTHGGQDADQKIFAEALLKKKLTPGEVSRFWKNKARQFILSDPLGYARLEFRKLLVFFREVERADEIDLILQRDWKRMLDINPFFMICPLALLGMILALPRRQGVEAALMIAAQLAVTLIFFMTTRHRVTVLPFFLIFESYALIWLLEQLSERRFRPVKAALVLLLGYWIFLPPEALDARTLDFLQAAKEGPVYEQRGDFPAARDRYLKAVALRPGDSNSYYNLGNVYWRSGDPVSAEAAYQKALALCGYNVDARFNLGALYEERGRLSEAVAAYQAVLAYQTDSPDVYFRLANIYARKGECAQAVENYQQVIRLRPALAPSVRPLISACR